jgi:hypothetical protein
MFSIRLSTMPERHLSRYTFGVDYPVIRQRKLYWAELLGVLTMGKE